MALSDRSDNETLLFRGAAMRRYYVFKGRPERHGFAGDPDLIITSDRTGGNLPERRSGSWKFLRAITLIPGSSSGVIGSHDSAMDAIGQKGYCQIALQNLDMEIRRSPLGEGKLSGPQFRRADRVNEC